MQAAGGAGAPTLSSMLPSLATSAEAARPTRNLKLQKFDMSRIADDSVIVFIGKRNTGKSFLIRDLLWHKRSMPVGTVLSGTEGANCFYSQIVPSILIHEEFNPTIISGVIKRQQAITKMIMKEKSVKGGSAIDRRTFVIMDDCMYDNKWVTDKWIRSLFMNGRHYGIMYILALQYVMGIPPVLRGNVDFVFILRENMVSNRRRIYEQFAGIFPTFEFFCQIMDQCTENYECLVIHNGSKSNKLEECVFWYKAETHPDFKIGARDLWIKSAEFEREKERQEALGEGGTPLSSTDFQKKTSAPIIQVKKY